MWIEARRVFADVSACLEVAAVGHIGLTRNATTISCAKATADASSNSLSRPQANALKVHQASVCGRASSQRADPSGSSRRSGTAARRATLGQGLRAGSNRRYDTSTRLIFSPRRLSAQDYAEADLRPISILAVPVDGSQRLTVVR